MNSIFELLKVEQSKRNLNWEKDFLKSFVEGPLYLVNDEPFLGPDGFSYMELSTQGQEPLNFSHFLEWAVNEGVGIVLNIQEKKSPDYVFTYGMLWNYSYRGSFINEEPETPQASSDHVILVHEIHEGYFPRIVRDHVDNYLSHNKISGTEVTLLSRGEGTSYELIWYCPVFEKMKESEITEFLRAVSWFLPADYSLGAAQEKGTQFRFTPL